MWRKQDDGTWWPSGFDLGVIDRMGAEQKVAIEQEAVEIAALKERRPHIFITQAYLVKGWQGETALTWCAAAPCCSWKVEAPCPDGYSVFSGGCELANTGWVPGRAIASLAVNAPTLVGKGWACEARLKDNCVDVTLAARAICMTDSSIVR